MMACADAFKASLWHDVESTTLAVAAYTRLSRELSRLMTETSPSDYSVNANIRQIFRFDEDKEERYLPLWHVSRHASLRRLGLSLQTRAALTQSRLDTCRLRCSRHCRNV